MEDENIKMEENPNPNPQSQSPTTTPTKTGLNQVSSPQPPKTTATNSDTDAIDAIDAIDEEDNTPTSRKKLGTRKKKVASEGMDPYHPPGFPRPQPDSNGNDQVNVIDSFHSQASFTSNASQFNPQIPVPPISSPFLNTNPQYQNQFQTNYSFPPAEFIPPLQQQYPFQSPSNTLALPSEPETLKSSSKRGRKPKIPPNSQAKDSEPPPQPLRRNWTKEEDVALTKAWLHISINQNCRKDPSGKDDTLWNRIHVAWKEFMADDFVEDRPTNGLACRWSTIQGAINKFHGIYEQLARSPTNGASTDDLKKDANEVYKETSADNKPFAFEHCWVECTKDPKWCVQQLNMNSSKRQKSNDGSPSTQNSSTQTVTPSSILNDIEAIDVDTPGTESIDVDAIIPPPPPGRRNSEKRKKPGQDKGMEEIMSKLQVSLQQQFNLNQEELELKREMAQTMKKEYELRELAMKKELELKEKDLALKEKAQRRANQQKILNQDLTKLTLEARGVIEKMQQRILVEWEEEDFVV